MKFVAMATVTDKICPGCLSPIPLLVDSRQKYCSQSCGNRVRNRSYAARHPEKIKANRVKQNGTTVSRILSRVKSRAKALGKDFNLDHSDIVIPAVCPVLGIPLSLNNNGAGYHSNSPSLDRIDNSKGYVKGNVRVISARANLLKNDATIEELELVLEDLRRCSGKEGSGNEDRGDGH